MEQLGESSSNSAQILTTLQFRCGETCARLHVLVSADLHSMQFAKSLWDMGILYRPKTTVCAGLFAVKVATIASTCHSVDIRCSSLQLLVDPVTIDIVKSGWKQLAINILYDVSGQLNRYYRQLFFCGFRSCAPFGSGVLTWHEDGLYKNMSYYFRLALVMVDRKHIRFAFRHRFLFQFG